MKNVPVAVLTLAIFFMMGCKKEHSASIPDQTEINKLKLNQIQVIGSHNSYHLRMSKELFGFLNNIDFLIPAQYKVSALDYFQEPLEDQLDKYQLRSFEIDIYADPVGGRFYNRQGNVLIGKPAASQILELRQPGFKVLHIPDIDFETYFITFKDNLQALKNWSDKHPNHLPIFILLEGKEKTIGDVIGFLGFTTAIKFTPELTDAIDQEIKDVFGNDLKQVITPDQVRGSYATLEEAVLAGNWPTIGDARGKFVFIMQGGPVDDYLVGHPTLEGRVMFVNSLPHHPEAAFPQYNDAPGSESDIIDAVKKGYITRSMAGNDAKKEAAFRSGSQIISTDYYRADPRHFTDPRYSDFECRFPNGELARINEISAPDKQGLGKIAE